MDWLGCQRKRGVRGESGFFAWTERVAIKEQCWRDQNFGCCCSVSQLHLTLCDPMDCSTPGFPVLRHLLELAQTHVHWVGDAIQPFRPLPSPSPISTSIKISKKCTDITLKYAFLFGRPNFTLGFGNYRPQQAYWKSCVKQTCDHLKWYVSSPQLC